MIKGEGPRMRVGQPRFIWVVGIGKEMGFDDSLDKVFYLLLFLHFLFYWITIQMYQFP